MKRFLFILSFCLCFTAQASDLVSYQYRDSIEIAKTTNQLIYLIFIGQDCPWCDKQKETINKEEIIDLIDKYLLVFLDTEEQQDIAKRYRVRAIPCHFIINSDEVIFKKAIGYQDKNKLEKFIKE